MTSETTPNADSKTKKPRSANWTTREESQLASSWVTISQRPDIGTNQTIEQFFQLVAEDFCKHNKENGRDVGQIKTVWQKINTAVIKFVGIYHKVTTIRRSGTSPEDWLREAKELFSNQNKGKPFKYEAAWLKLRILPKFKVPESPHALITNIPAFDPTANPEEKEANNDSTQATPHRPPSPDRPIGNKRAKKARLAKIKDEEAEDAAIERDRVAAQLAERRVAAMEAHNQIANSKMKLEEEAHDMRILSMDIDTMPDELSKAALRAKKASILSKMSLDTSNASPATGASPNSSS